MIRSVLAIIIGYVAIAITVFFGLTGAYVALGSEGAFEPGIYELTTAWVVTAVGANLVAAIIGGIVCALIARKKAVPVVFAAIVFVLGILVAVPSMMADETEQVARPEGITMFDAMKEARQPTWFSLSNPFVAAIGIMLGASLISSRNTPRG